MHYHRERAEQERRRAREAASAVAADAHLTLAALHEQRVSALREETARAQTTLHAVFAKAQ
jgi:hypothetical protein